MTLQKYGVMNTSSGDTIPIEQFHKKEVLIPFILKYGARFGTTSLAISGSLFLKRYAVLTAAAALDYFGFQQQKGDWWTTASVDMNNFTIVVEDSTLQLINQDWMQFVFVEHLNLVVDLLAKECKIPSKMLWENIAVRLNAVIREKLITCSVAEVKLQYERLVTLSCESKGKIIYPFQSIVHMDFIDDYNPKRKTCCRYYEVSQPDDLPYCNVCPLVNKRLNTQ